MEQNWYLNQFWSEDGPYSAIADMNSIPSEPSYWSSGFLSIQFAIENSFLEVCFIQKGLNLNFTLDGQQNNQFPSLLAKNAFSTIQVNDDFVIFLQILKYLIDFDKI